MAGRPDAAVDWRFPRLDTLSPLLTSALNAFYVNGYHGTSVRDIARGADMTVPGLYYHYSSKQEILVDLLDNSITAVGDFARAADAEAGADPDKRFEYLIEALVLYMANHPKNAAMDAEIRALDPENRRRYSAKRRTVERRLVRSIEDGRRAGRFEVTDPADTARALLGMIQSIPLWFKPTGRLGPSGLAQRYVDIARHSVGASRADRPVR